MVLSDSEIDEILDWFREVKLCILSTDLPETKGRENLESCRKRLNDTIIFRFSGIHKLENKAKCFEMTFKPKDENLSKEFNKWRTKAKCFMDILQEQRSQIKHADRQDVMKLLFRRTYLEREQLDKITLNISEYIFNNYL